MTALQLESKNWCFKAYQNYHQYGNTMGLSGDDMGKITQRWDSEITSWQETIKECASEDGNEYEIEFDDSEYANYKENGKEAAKNATGGFDGKNKSGDSIATATMGGAGIGFGTWGAFTKSAPKTAPATTGSTTSGTTNSSSASTTGTNANASNSTSSSAGQQGAKNGAKAQKNVGAIVAACLAIVTAAKYWLEKPNKEEKSACDKLQTEMTAADADLADQQATMEEKSAEIIDLSDQANEVNEEANDEIEEQKTEFDLYNATVKAIQAKKDSGVALSDSEKALYKESVKYLQESSVNLEELTDETGEEVTDLYDEMGVYQDDYDAVAESMGEIEGLTDFAEGFDEKTQKLCYVEAAGQYANVASAGLAAAKLFCGPWWNWALAIGATLAGASSGVAGSQQLGMAGDVGTEINMREATQDLNTETQGVYEEEIDAYAGYLEGVEVLELEIPDEMGSPEEIEEMTANASSVLATDAVPKEEANKDLQKPKKEAEEKA